MENGISEQHQTVYAEVLYTFKAVGAEELSLERGALVEVLRMETGPWWWGQIKHDAILSPQNEQRQGWFPRDFVKVSEQTERLKIIFNGCISRLISVHQFIMCVSHFSF